MADRTMNRRSSRAIVYLERRRRSCARWRRRPRVTRARRRAHRTA